VKVENARRLTGRGFFLPGAGAVVELWLEAGDDRTPLELAWDAVLLQVLARLGIGRDAVALHTRASGWTTSIAVPIDQLLAVADVLEAAGLSLAATTEVPFSEALLDFEAALVAQANPALLALEAAAKACRVPFLWDDDAVSLGLGVHAQVFLPTALPAVAEVAWEQRGKVPTAMVTGTNGKTTTTRMTAAIMAAAGYVVGLSSTDAIEVAGEIVEAGDWTGPGAARRVLRDPRVTAAVLETARGGILRRGLAYERVDAAVVTNIGEDHFGDYGITSIEDMARVKAVVWDGVKPGGKRIANAGCPVSQAHLARAVPALIGGNDWVLFGRVHEGVLARHADAGGEAWSIEAGALTHWQGRLATSVVVVADIPATFGGAAVHNIDNALAAAAVAFAMGADHAAIAAGLGAFGRTPHDNPGRLEVYALDGVRIVLDFAHNAHGVHALAPVIASLRASHPGSRLFVVAGQAGDRSDHDMFELAREVYALGPDRVAVRPMIGYERGRRPGEVEAVLQAAFRDLGLPVTSFTTVADELEALALGRAWAKPGDIVLIIVHIQRDAVQAWLAGQASSRDAHTASGRVA